MTFWIRLLDLSQRQNIVFIPLLCRDCAFPAACNCKKKKRKKKRILYCHDFPSHFHIYFFGSTCAISRPRCHTPEMEELQRFLCDNLCHSITNSKQNVREGGREAADLDVEQIYSVQSRQGGMLAFMSARPLSHLIQGAAAKVQS